MIFRNFDIAAALRRTTFNPWHGMVALALVAVVWRCDANVIGNATANADGTYTYSYTIDNRLGTFDVISMSLELAIPPGQIDWDQLDAPSGGGVAVPNANWIAQAGLPTLGLSSQDFFSLVPASDVLIGGTLSGFSFVSRHRPGNIDYYIEYGSRAETETGFTVGPVFGAVSVPDSEPGTGALVAAVWTCLGAIRWGRQLMGSRRAL